MLRKSNRNNQQQADKNITQQSYQEDINSQHYGKNLKSSTEPLSQNLNYPLNYKAESNDAIINQKRQSSEVRRIKVQNRNYNEKMLPLPSTNFSTDFQGLNQQYKAKLIESISILMRVNEYLMKGQIIEQDLQDEIQGFIIQNNKFINQATISESQQNQEDNDKLELTIAKIQQEMMNQELPINQRKNVNNNANHYGDSSMLMKSLELQDLNMIKEVGGSSWNQQRHNSTQVRGRDKTVGIPKRKKKLMVEPYGDEQQVSQYSSTGRQGVFGVGQSFKRSSVQSKRSRHYKQELEQSNSLTKRQLSPMNVRKSINPRKNIIQNYNKSTNNYQLQEVGIFKNFLLQNDSQYAEYVSNELILNLLDSQMMKENMISFMAQLMGNGSNKDNFYLRTRSAIQDTLGLFFITKNISQNNSVEFYLPRLIEMVSDLLDADRCSVYLYDRIKDEIYCKVITGRMKDPICFPRQQQNVLCQVFNTGETIFVKNIEQVQSENLASYLQVDNKLHYVTRNFMIVPIKLGNNAVGCFELANKRGQQEFTDHDLSVVSQICQEIAAGLIAYEMKHNIKKEFDDELKHVKGLMGEIYQQTLIPLLNDMQRAIQNLLKAEKVIIFMHNKDIDHLYSFSTVQDQNQQSQFNPLNNTFGIDTIRMKSNIGLAGRAFTHSQICKESDMISAKFISAEEKDLSKLKISKVNNVLSIPVLEKQNNTPISVIQIYNYDPAALDAINEEVLWNFSQFMSQVMFTVDLQQGTMLSQDILEAQFNLITEGVIILNTMGIVTKINKPAELMLNQSSQVEIGKHLSEILSPLNNHLFSVFSERLTSAQLLQQSSKKTTSHSSSIFYTLTATLSFSSLTYYHLNKNNQSSYFQTSLTAFAEDNVSSNKIDPYERSRSKIPIADDAVIIAGSSNPALAKQIEEHLGVKLAKTKLTHFADGETHVRVFDNVNGKHIYIIQPTCSPVNENVMELILTVSAVKRAGAASVTVLTPYYGYARQDRKHYFNVPISNSDIAHILEYMGVNRIVGVDLHVSQAQGFVSPKTAVDNLEGGHAGLNYFIKTIENKKDIVIVSPDAGGMHRAKTFHDSFDYFGYGADQIGLAMIHKERKEANKVDSMQLIGNVEGKVCIIVDDMIDTAGTLCEAAKTLKQNGAKKVYAFATHGLFNSPAGDRIANSQDLELVVTTDSVPLKQEFKNKVGDKHVQVSLGLMLAETIRRIHQKESLDQLFEIPLY